MAPLGPGVDPGDQREGRIALMSQVFPLPRSVTVDAEARGIAQDRPR